MDVEQFAAMPRDEAMTWLLRRQEENRQRALAECAANGAHVMACEASACPHCGTPYVEVSS